MGLRRCVHLIAIVGGRKTALTLAALVTGILAFTTPASSSVTGTAGNLAADQATALDQLTWLIGASTRVPVSAAELQQHLAAQLLAASGGAAGFNAALTRLGPLTLEQLLLNQPSHVEALINGTSSNEMNLRTDTSGLIDGFGLTPYVPSPRTWQELDTSLSALAPQASFASMTISPQGGCRLVHGVNAATAEPAGSAFTLYVLGALGHAVAAHQASWDEQLAINDQWKSLDPGVLQKAAAGTELTLSTYVGFMMSIGDRTAIDHLIHFLGRKAVQDQFLRFGNQDARRNFPLLTTREFLALKGVDYPALASSYLADPRSQRAAELATVDQIPLSQISLWTQPEMINQIGWFASPIDLCRAYAGLWRQNQQPALNGIGTAMDYYDGGIGLDRTQYPVVWFVAGTEPGVLTLSFLAQAADGQLFVSSVMLANPENGNLGTNAIIGKAFALVRGGIQLADQPGR